MEVEELPELTLKSRGTAFEGGIFWVTSDLGLVKESEKEMEKAGEEEDYGEDDYG